MSSLGGNISEALVVISNPVYTVKSYGAKGNGVTDDTAAIQAAITAAAAGVSPGTVLLPPGQYLISSTLNIGPYSSGSSAPVPYPSLIALGATGRIGDATDTSAVQFICGPTFTSGTFALRVMAPNNTVAPSGIRLRGFGVKCNNLAAGIYIEQPRMMHASDISVDHAVAPTGSPNGATGAFNIIQIKGTAAAYNVFDHIVTSYAANDGIVHTAADNAVWANCFDLNSTRYAYNISGFSRWIACHYEASRYGVLTLGGSAPIALVGWDFFGVPTENTVQITSNSSPGHAVEFIGCRFGNNPGASPGEEAGSIIAVQNNGHPVRAQFIGCELIADTNTTDFVYVEAAVVAGSHVEFLNCDMIGIPTTANFNDASGQGVLHFRDCFGINPVGVVTVAVPASGVAVATAPYDRTFYVTAGTDAVTLTIENGPTIKVPANAMGTVHVPVGKTLTPTYTATHPPTWVVEGE